MFSLRILAPILLILSAALFAGDETNEASIDPFEEALSEVGLTRESMTFDYGDMANYGGDRFVLPLFYTLHSDFFKIEHYTNIYKASVKRNAGRLQNLIGFASSRLDESVRRGLIGDPLKEIYPLIAEQYALANAIERLIESTGNGSLSEDEIVSLEQSVSTLPDELQLIAALLIYASVDSLHYHARAFEKAAEKYDLSEMYGRAQLLLASDDDIIDFTLEEFASLVDFKYLYTHVQDLARAVDYAADSLAAVTFDDSFSFEYDTPLGRIVINDGSDQNYPDDEYYLIIDVGGDDCYEGGGANRSIENWISILIDLGGDDTYESSGEGIPSFGAGLFGYAFLVDVDGNDIYSGRNMTGGVGLFGVGALLDKAGTDSYDGFICAQGAGQFGIGILSDLDGNDSYHMYLLGQGFGFTKGMGMLIDMKGDDDYHADTLDIVFPASQTKDYNSNLAQGVGFGKRGDYIDGHSWAGGIGMLVDAEGNDKYSAGLFAQGCAYWYAIGILADDKGDDEYRGVWYVQGSGAHFGLGILIDSTGDDHYTATKNMAQGAGHDFTLGTLIDCEGNDVYDAPNLSLGGGNANGIGIFWDKSGDDIYRVTAATTLGRSNVAGKRGGLRDHIMCLGLFLDTGGDDTYPVKYDFTSNNKLWRQYGTNTEHPVEVEMGVGYDCEWPDTSAAGR